MDRGSETQPQVVENVIKSTWQDKGSSLTLSDLNVYPLEGVPPCRDPHEQNTYIIL